MAQDLLVIRKKEVIEGKEPLPVKRIPNHSFRELADHYLVWAERQRSFSSKRVFIKQLVEVFGNCPLRRFSIRVVEEWQTERMTRNKPATVNRVLETLKHMFTKAVDWEMVEEDALKKIRKVKHLPENNRRLRYLSKDECRALIKACKPHLQPIVITALNTGMRKEEILSLEWERHIDLNNGLILLDVTKNGERREIPMNKSVRTTFRELLRRVDSPYVFSDGNGKRYLDIKRSFKSAIRKTGIKDFRFHDLRHCFASHLVMAGVDLTAVQELLGHKNLTMTLRYAHLSPKHKVQAVEMLTELSDKKPTIQKLYSQREKEINQIA